MEYNKSQALAIQHKDGPMLVLAGPGSGKTAVITKRVKNLITEYHVDPGSILVITFTKAAAMEMKQRFFAMAGPNQAHVTFGTFHAVFFTVLKLAYHYESSNIISEEQKFKLMREIISHHHLEYRDENELITNLLGEISKIKNDRIPIEHFYSGQCGEEIFRDIYKEYQKRLKRARLIDFDDMLLYTYELFCERPDILEAWQKKYRYIMIDEFQDINQIQFDIVRQMAAPLNNLFVVGDDDQSIYRFRGSKPELMLAFRKSYPDAKQVLLDINYRCDERILADALHLIAHNRTRFDKKIVAFSKGEKGGTSQHPSGEEEGNISGVRYLGYENQRAQNDAILREIKALVEKGSHYEDFAILFRTNTQPRILTEQLMDENIPFRMRDHIPSLYEHWIAKDIFTYLRIAGGSRERTDFLQIMNRPKRYIGRDSLCEPQVAFDEWIKLYEEQPWIGERIEKLWYDVKLLSKMSPYAAINYIRRGIGYDDYLKEYSDYHNLNPEDLLDILEELQATSKGYQNYEEWFLHIREYSDRMKEQERARSEMANAVTLATLHSAKGLEFENVYIIDANEGIMPYKKAVLEQDIEEERRLFYVGMTRAKKNLCICYTSSVNDKSMEPSRFLGEAKGETAGQ